MTVLRDKILVLYSFWLEGLLGRRGGRNWHLGGGGGKDPLCTGKGWGGGKKKGKGDMVICLHTFLRPAPIYLPLLLSACICLRI